MAAQCQHLAKITGVLAVFFSLLGCAADPVDVIGIPTDQASVRRGQVLVTGFAACGTCHGIDAEPHAALSGGRTVYDLYGAVLAPNITPAKSGIGAWNAGDFVRLMRSSMAPNERRISAEVHSGYEWMSDRDLFSILAYLSMVPPIENAVERRDVSFIARNTTGILELEPKVSGYVPAPEMRFEREYGEYIVKHVARCTACHNTPSTFMSDEVAFGGGRLVKSAEGEVIVPALLNSASAGIGAWSEQDLENYLASGETPSAGLAHAEFCPVRFYANAPAKEVQAVVKYLKSLPVGSGS